MSLFVCEKCGAIENTALCLYWGSEKKICSECDPRIGKWHGNWKKEYFNNEEWEYYDGHYVQRKTNNVEKGSDDF